MKLNKICSIIIMLLMATQMDASSYQPRKPHRGYNQRPPRKTGYGSFNGKASTYGSSSDRWRAQPTPTAVLTGGRVVMVKASTESVNDAAAQYAALSEVVQVVARTPQSQQAHLEKIFALWDETVQCYEAYKEMHKNSVARENQIRLELQREKERARILAIQIANFNAQRNNASPIIITFSEESSYKSETPRACNPDQVNEWQKLQELVVQNNAGALEKFKTENPGQVLKLINVHHQGETLLHDAAGADCFEAAQWLTANGANYNADTNELRTPLLAAIGSNSARIAKHLLQQKHINLTPAGLDYATIAQEAFEKDQFYTHKKAKQTEAERCENSIQILTALQASERD